MSKARTRIHLTPQERSVIELTVAAVSEILDKIMSEQSAKEYAIMLCKPHRQSTKSIASTSLIFNIVNGNQELPARREYIRERLPGERADGLFPEAIFPGKLNRISSSPDVDQ
jgi:hypothetical protein